MSFSIQLQKNMSPVNKLGKSVTTLATWEGTLKNGSSIINPIILVQSNDLISNCNYMTIPAFGRKYFINNIIAVSNQLVEIHAHVDVLDSVESQLKALECIVSRQENNFQLYLDDGSFKTFNNPLIVTKQFPLGFTHHQYVLAVSGEVA